MNVLVTGANGFVGRALIMRLLEKNYEVRAAVRQSCGMANEYVIGDIGPDTDWTVALRGGHAVVHLASRVHVMRDRSTDPRAAYLEVNTKGTLNLARQAADAGISRFVFTSTIKVHGEGGDAAYTEADLPAPQDAYALSKWEAEQGLREIAAETGMEVVILRFPMVYGPGVGANFLRLIHAVDNGFPLPFGGIDNHRSLIYLGNLVDAIVTCLTHSDAANKTFLLSDDEDVSTPELIRRLAKALSCPARMTHIPASWLRMAGKLVGKSKEIDRLLGSLVVDGRAMHRELGWSPPFSMDEGLTTTIKWYQGRYGNEQ